MAVEQAARSVATVVERPYLGGIRGDVPPQLVPVGSCLEAKNLTGVTGGLRRRPGIDYFIGASPGNARIPYPPGQEMVTFWRTDGTQELLLADQKFLYNCIPPDTLTGIYWEFTFSATINLSSSSTAVSAASDTGWDDVEEQIQYGDILVYGASYQYQSIIATISSGTALTLTANAAITDAAHATWKIRRALAAVSPFLVDWTVITGGTPAVLFADGARFLTRYDGSTYSTYLRTYTTGTISNTGTAVTGVGTSWLTEGFQAGDIIRIDTGGTVHEYAITSVNSNTSITLPSDPGAHAGVQYLIHEAPTIIPVAVAYFKNRTWIANMYESSKWHRQRIRWTEVGDLDDFRNGGYVDLPYVQGAIKRLVPMGDFLVAFFDDAIYIGRATNLPSLPMSFQKLETNGVGLLGPKAVCSGVDSLFFIGQDDIYQLSVRGLQGIGTPVVKRTIQQVASTRHWKLCAVPDVQHDRILFGFTKSSDEVEEVWSYNYKTKAWAWENINCYMLSANIWAGVKTWENWVTQDYDTGQLSTNGTTTLTGSGTTWTSGMVGYKVVIDIDNDGNYEFESYITVRTSNTDVTINDVAPTSGGGWRNYRFVPSTATWEGSEMNQYPSWQSIKGTATTIKNVYVIKYDTIWNYIDNKTTDSGSVIATELITGDRDFDLPDDEKIFYSLAVKLETWMLSDLVFQVYGSNDRGQHWKSLGNLTIPAGKDEGKVDFRLRGSCVRFRLISVSQVEEYTINELTYDARVMGAETQGRGDAV